LNVNITRDLNVSHTETQEEVHVSEIPVSEGRVNEILDGSDEEDVIHGSGEEDVEHGNGPESVKETSGTYHDDGDEDDDILVDEENKIVEPDVDVHLFDIRKDVPCDNTGVTSLVLDDVLKGEDLDVVNPDGFNSDTGNDNEISTYKRRRLDDFRIEMEGFMNASGRWKYSFYTSQKFYSSKEAKDRVYLYSNESRRMLKLCKNGKIRVRARCEGNMPVFIMS
ncbi:hypothetical protein Tco_0020909, partial [Tanacetum coccineum]